jgi:hypothetical protein
MDPQRAVMSGNLAVPRMVISRNWLPRSSQRRAGASDNAQEINEQRQVRFGFMESYKKAQREESEQGSLF